jgi:hypothetical protein
MLDFLRNDPRRSPTASAPRFRGYGALRGVNGAVGKRREAAGPTWPSAASGSKDCFG